MPEKSRDVEFARALRRSIDAERPDDVRARLSRIAREGSVVLVADVAPLLAVEDYTLAARACLESLFDRAPALEFVRLDVAQRERLAPRISDWPRDRAERILLGKRSVLGRRPVPPALAAVAAGHQDGRVRQAALEVLARQEPGRAGLAMALIRCNDWVESVRRLARTVVEGCLVPDLAADLADLLPLVLRLRDCRRGEHRPLVDAICEFLRRGDDAPRLRHALDSHDSRVRRAALEVARDLEPRPAERFFRHALGHPGPVARMIAFRELSRRLAPDDLVTLAREGILDDCGIVRREALFVLHDHPPRDLPALLEELVLDSNRTVAWVAFDLLQRRFGSDPIRLIRAELADPESPRLERALASIETGGDRTDVPVVVERLGHRRPRVRAAALLAYAKLAGDEDVRPRLAESLLDAAPRVSRTALRLLRRRSPLGLEAVLERGFAPERPPHVRRNSLSLLATVPGLDGLERLLRHHDDPDPDIANIARTQMWHPRFRPRAWTGIPSTEAVERVLALLERVPPPPPQRHRRFTRDDKALLEADLRALLGR
ncbi:MAG: hypothetical protein R3F20_08255 [Planctomycetota bacterium]